MQQLLNYIHYLLLWCLVDLLESFRSPVLCLSMWKMKSIIIETIGMVTTATLNHYSYAIALLRPALLTTNSICYTYTLYSFKFFHYWSASAGPKVCPEYLVVILYWFNELNFCINKIQMSRVVRLNVQVFVTLCSLKRWGPDCDLKYFFDKYILFVTRVYLCFTTPNRYRLCLQHNHNVF